MSLSAHVPNKGAKYGHLSRYSERNHDIPKHEMPKHSMTALAAVDFIRSELRLDGNPNLNLASFVTTEVDKEAHELIQESLNKNMPDQDQYPHSNDIQDRCINILAHLWNAPSTESDHAVGTATIGSSEAILLAGLAMKWRWRGRRAKAKKVESHEILERPNIIFSAAVHVSILKLCRFFDIDARVLAVEKDRLVIDTDEVIRQCDDKTAGVFLILGTTLTGELEDIDAMNTKLLALKKDKGLDIPIHVDGASGAFVIPFVWPEVKWDFRLEQVRSINTSGHKYGLTYPGLGWVVWKTKEDLPDGLIFHVNYLGIDEPTYSLNFSKSASTVIGQYYNFLRLGHDGYTVIMQQCIANAKLLSEHLQSLGLFTILSKHDSPALPLVAFRITKDEELGADATVLVHELRGKGWIVPAYTLPANAADVMIMRVVVRETFTREMVYMLVEDIRLILITIAHSHGKDALKAQLIAAKDSDTGHHRRNKHHTEQVKGLVQQVVTENKAGVSSFAQPQEGGNNNKDAEKVNEMKRVGAKEDKKGGGAAEEKKEKDGGASGPPTVHTIC